MLNCKQASELMSQAMDTKLPFGKRMSLKLHLLMCHGCTNFMNQMAFLRRAAQHIGTSKYCASMRLSDEAKQRIHEALRAHDKRH